MPRQLSLLFGDDASAETPSPVAPSSEPAEVDVDAVAAALRPQLLEYLRQADDELEMRELRNALGHPGEYMDPDPLSNPVNRLVKEMRDAGELVVREFDRGSPLVSLPAAEPAAAPATSEPGSDEHDVEQLADRRVRARKEGYAAGLPTEGTIAEIMAAAKQRWPKTYDSTVVRSYSTGRQVEVLLRKDGYHGRTLVRKAVFDLVADTESSDSSAHQSPPGSWEHDVEQRFDANFVQPVLREVEAKPWQTSEAIGNRALGRKQIRNVIRTAADILRKQVTAGMVQIAWDQSGMPHYALAGLDVPEHLATQEQIDAAGGNFPSSEETSPEVAPPPFVRPDRQSTFDGVPHYEWPKPEEDRDSITVDRLYDDIDGQSHRFLIRRGDLVEVFFRRDKVECGEVVGISHARGEVRVRFGDSGEGIWFAVGQLYPTPEEQDAEPDTVPLSSVVQEASIEPPGGFTEADRVPAESAGGAASAGLSRESAGKGVDSLANQRPYSLHEFRAYRDRFDAGELSLAEHQGEFRRLRATKDAFVIDLKQQYDADRLKVLASRFGCFDANRNTASEELSNRPLECADAGFAEYPYPQIYRRHLEELVAVARNKSGLKQLSRRLDSFLVTDREKHFVEFVDDRDIAFLQDYLARCKRARLETRWVEQGMEDWKRMRAANIYTPQELRCSLRELVPHLRKREGDDPVQVAEQELIGRKIPGFFPTPRPVISRMLELAGIEDGDRVLEPSAGKGDILDMLREQYPDTTRTALEVDASLIDVIATKGHDVERANFLEYDGEHDVVVMNPPFENLQDIDHVQHAFEQLAAGGRLVSVMSAGGFFRSDKKAEQFRAWLEELDAEVEDLPEDAFQGVEAFRQTGVRTKLVSLSRPESSPVDH